MSDTTAVPPPDMATTDPRESDPAAPKSILARARAVIARPWIVNTIRILFIAAVLAAVAYTVIGSWKDIRDYLFDLAWQSVLLAFAAAFAGMAANIMAWRSIVTQLDSPVTITTAARITLLGNLAKYLPGSVWSYVAQMELGKRAGIPRARAFIASLIAVGLSTTASLILGALAIPALAASDEGKPFVPIVIALIPIALTCAHPKILTRLVELFLKIVRKPPLGHAITWRTVNTATAWSAIAYVCFGVHLWLLANAAATPGVEGLFRSIGAFALAMTCGMLVIIVPSGIGVRDAVIATALTPYVGFGTAAGIAVVSRLIFTLADLIAAGAAGASAFTEMRHHRPATKDA